MNPHSLGLTSSLLSGLDQRLLQQQQQQLLQNHFRLGTQALDPALIARAQLTSQLPRLPQLPQLPQVIDPMLAAQYGYSQLLHGAGARKNATRESTTPLKNWLKEHQKNPYPTKGEKVYLALISGMTLTQVSTWFANARRRLKKENKWSPSSGFEDDDSSSSPNKPSSVIDEESNAVKRVSEDHVESGYSSHHSLSDQSSEASPERADSPTVSEPAPIRVSAISAQIPVSPPSSLPRPKIWSLAEMTTSSDEEEELNVN